MSIVKKVWHISNTNKTIDSFIPSNKGIFGPGIYTTSNFEKIKKHYFDSKSKRYNGRVYELEVTLHNPIEGNAGILKDGSPFYQLIQAYISEYGAEEGGMMAVEYAKKLGHDGVIRKSSDGTEIILPFDNNSIKIINNNVNMEQNMDKKNQELTEKDFVYNGRKDWQLYKESIKKKVFSEKEKIKGGLADNMSLEDIAKKHNVALDDIKKEYENGIKVEKEHTTSEKTAAEIAKDHLLEDPKYYSKLSTAKLEEKQDCTPWKPGCKKQKGKNTIRAGLQWGITPAWIAGGVDTNSTGSDGGGAGGAMEENKILDEEKKKTIIRPDRQRAAPAQGSTALSNQAAGPGTTSPAGPAASVSESATKIYPKPMKLSNYPKTKNPSKMTTVDVEPFTSVNINSLLDKFEQGGLDAIGIDGHNLLLNNIENMTPEQQMRFDSINVMAETKHDNKIKQIKQVGSNLDRSGNKHMPPSKRVEGDKRQRLIRKAEKYDETENLSKYFKEAWKRNLKKK